MLTSLIVISVGVLCAAYLLYSPIPDNVEEPWKTRVALAVLKLNLLVINTAKMLGFDAIAVNRRTLSTVFSMLGTGPNNVSAVHVYDKTMEGVPVRVYIPNDPRVKPMTAMVYFHGGGFHLFDTDTYDKVMREVSAQSDAVIIVPQYRLSPEHLFPAAFEDCLAVTEHFVENADLYGVEKNQIGVGGDSAGGNLAAAVSHHLAYERKSKTKLQFQALIYPMLQAFDFRLPSFVLNEGILSPTLHAENIIASYLMYWKGRDAVKYVPVLAANNHTSAKLKQSKYANFLSISLLPEDIRRNISDDFEESLHDGTHSVAKDFETTMLNPLFSPLLAEDLSKMPTTFLLASGYDVLRDDALMYGERLIAAGVDVRVMRRDDGFHGMFSFTRLQIGSDSLRDLVHFIKSY